MRFNHLLTNAHAQVKLARYNSLTHETVQSDETVTFSIHHTLPYLNLKLSLDIYEVIILLFYLTRNNRKIIQQVTRI